MKTAQLLGLALLAWRNIFRNGRRTAITVLSLVIGFIAIACFAGFVEFSFEGLRETTIRTRLGHLQIYADGYWDKRISAPETVMISDPGEIEEEISRIRGVSAVSRRLSFSGLGSVGNASANVAVLGVDPDRERDFSYFSILIDGRRLRPGDTDAGVIGEELSKGLGAKVGDWLTVLTSSLDGIVNAVDFNIVGIVRTGSTEFDSVLAKVPIGVAQRALETDKVERIVVLLDNTDDLPVLRPKIERRLAQLGRVLEVRQWDELAGFYDSVVSLYTGIFNVFAAIIGMVVMFSVANTMTMAVYERTAEIGALRAIGARRSTLVAMFLWEGIGIGILGCVLGAASSWLVASMIEIAGGIGMPPPPGMSSGYQAYLSVTWEILLKSAAIVMCATLLSCLYPAFAASRIRIVEALNTR